MSERVKAKCYSDGVVKQRIQLRSEGEVGYAVRKPIGLSKLLQRKGNAVQRSCHDPCSARVRNVMIVGGSMGNLPDADSSNAILGVSQRLSDTSSEDTSAVWFGGSAAK